MAPVNLVFSIAALSVLHQTNEVTNRAGPGVSNQEIDDFGLSEIASQFTESQRIASTLNVALSLRAALAMTESLSFTLAPVFHAFAVVWICSGLHGGAKRTNVNNTGPRR